MIAKEGRIILIPLLIITLPIGIYAHLVDNNLFSSIYFFLGILFLFCINFFRDPKRNIPMGDNLIISPADGKIVKIIGINDSDVGDAKLVSIFLNVFNVHVNRIPVAGTIEDIRYNPGKFLAAFNPKASMDNEQNVIMIKNGKTNIYVKQIAGLIARRIVCWPKKGDYYESGQRYGLIRFGSRVDILLPETTKLSVACGDRVSGGKSVIGYLT